MNRILLSLFLLFGLSSFALAENEKVTIKVFTGPAVCESTNLLDFCEILVVVGAEDAVIELVKDEDSTEDYQTFSGEWSKDYSDERLDYSAKIMVQKSITSAHGHTYTTYWLGAFTGPTQDTQGGLTMGGNSITNLLANMTSAMSGPLPKNGKFYRSMLTFGNLTVDSTENSIKIFQESVNK